MSISIFLLIDNKRKDKEIKRCKKLAFKFYSIVVALHFNYKDYFAHSLQQLFLLTKDDHERIITLGLDNFDLFHDKCRISYYNLEQACQI
jgi:hypothetical protein